jgi:hypothetical protein
MQPLINAILFLPLMNGKIIFFSLIFIAITVLRISFNIKPKDLPLSVMIKTVAFGLFPALWCYIILFIFSLIIPCLCMYWLFKDLIKCGKCTYIDLIPTCVRYFKCMLSALPVLYLIDYIQDIATKYEGYNNTDDIQQYFKYIIHCLLSPIFFLDIVYNFKVDEKLYHDLEKAPTVVPAYPFSIFGCFLANAVFVLYLVYAAAILCVYYYNPLGESLEARWLGHILKHKPYMALQLLSCAIVNFLIALYIQKKE